MELFIDVWVQPLFSATTTGQPKMGWCSYPKFGHEYIAGWVVYKKRTKLF